jgi:hypothetical protein
MHDWKTIGPFTVSIQDDVRTFRFECSNTPGEDHKLWGDIFSGGDQNRRHVGFRASLDQLRDLRYLIDWAIKSAEKEGG